MNLSANPIKFLFQCMKGFGVGLSSLLILEAGQAICQILLPKAIQTIIDGALESKEVASNWDLLLDKISEPLTFFFLLNLGILVFARASGAVMAWVDPALRKATQAKLFKYLQNHSHRYFLNNFSGAIASRVSETAVNVNHTLWVLWFDFWPIVITFIVSMILLAQVHMGLTLFLGSWIGAYVVISYYLGRKCLAYAEVYAGARSLVTGKVVDGVTNMYNAKLFARQEYERKYLDGYLKEEVKASRSIHWFMEKIRWFNFIAAIFLQVTMLVYALKAWAEGGITIGQFGMATTLTILIITEAQNLSRRFLDYFEYIGNVSDGINAIVQPHEVTDIKEATPLKVKRGAVEFQNVHFQYEEEKMIFENLNLQFNPGERVALVGYSGSGKSTFISLLLRLFDIQKGQILIDGQDIHGVNQDSLRSQVAMIPQDPMLFHRSIMENIRYGNLNATDEEVIAAAKAAHAHDFIMQLKDNYQTEVGERGVKLSGGQRQRIVIARAILKNAPILVMDEATASLDSKTEQDIQESMQNIVVGRTVFVVAHRLSTIAHLDRILVFNQGRIVEDGSHEELLALQGHYARLWNLQAGGFLPNYEQESENFSARYS